MIGLANHSILINSDTKFSCLIFVTSSRKKITNNVVNYYTAPRISVSGFVNFLVMYVFKQICPVIFNNKKIVDSFMFLIFKTDLLWRFPFRLHWYYSFYNIIILK